MLGRAFRKKNINGTGHHNAPKHASLVMLPPSIARLISYEQNHRNAFVLSQHQISWIRLAVAMSNVSFFASSTRKNALHATGLILA
jgi:hypothetical protein